MSMSSLVSGARDVYMFSDSIFCEICLVGLLFGALLLFLVFCCDHVSDLAGDSLRTLVFVLCVLDDVVSCVPEPAFAV